MSSKPQPRRPRDVNQLAHRLVAEMTGEVVDIEHPEGEAAQEPETEEEARSRAAAILGAAGGKKGGPARAKKLSKRRRKQIAELGAIARWKKAKTKR